MKKCIKCGNNKDESEYGLRSDDRSKRRNVCISCCREYSRNHYKNNKSSYLDVAKSFTKRQRIENRKRMLEFLIGKKCVDCGNDDKRVLEFDHRSNKKACISNLMQHNSWQRVLEEIAKCDIRCANCHRIKTANQFNYFRN